MIQSAANVTLIRTQTLGVPVSLCARSSNEVTTTRISIVGQTLRRRQPLRSGQSQDGVRWLAGNIQSARLFAPLTFDLKRRTATL